MKWAAVLVVVAIAIDGLPALNLPLGASSDPGTKTSTAIDVGVDISKAGGVTLTNAASRGEHLREATQESNIGSTVLQSADGTSSSQTDLESHSFEEIESNSNQEDTQALSVGGRDGLLQSKQTSRKSGDASKTQEDYIKEEFSSHETSLKDGTTRNREFLSESGEGSEDIEGEDSIGSGNQDVLSGFQARSSLAHRGHIRPFSHIPNHGPFETHAYNQHRNYASENGHYGSQTRNHGGASRHIGNFGAHNGDHRNSFWNHAYNSEQFARGAGHQPNNHFVSGTGIRHQGASSAEYINHAHDASQFYEGESQGADASQVNFVDSASDTGNQQTNSGEYDSGNVSDQSESSFEGSGYVDESFRRGLGKGVNTDQFVSEPENEGDNSGQYGSKAAVNTGDLKEVLKRGLNKHFTSATGNHNAIVRHGNEYQGNTNGDLRGFLNRPHFENQRVNPGKYNGIFAPTDNVNYGSGNGYHASPNQYLNRLLNRARGRLSYPGPIKPRPVPDKYINGGFAQGGHNDQYDIVDDGEESQDENTKYISDILTQAQQYLKHGAVPNSYGITPTHHYSGPQRRPVYETPNLGIRFYDAPTGSYMANPASTADGDDTYGGVAPGYVVPAVIVPEFNGYPNGQYYGPNYYSNGGIGSAPSFIPGIDRSNPTTIFGRNPSVLPLSTIPVRNVANVDDAVIIDKTLTFEPLPPLNPFKPLSPLIPLTPLTTFDTEYEGTSRGASEIIIDKDLLRATLESASSLKNDGTTTVINKDLTPKITQTTHPDSYNDKNSKIDNTVPTEKTILPKQTSEPVKGKEKIDEVLAKITKEKTDEDELVATGKDDDKTIINPGKSIIIDKNTVTKHIYNHGDVSKKDNTVKNIEKVLETNEESGPIEKKDDGTINYDKSNEKTATKKDLGLDDKPHSNDKDEISKTGKLFVIDKTLVINTINKEKGNKDQTSTKTREVSGTESKSETLDKSDEGNTTNGKSIVIDETTEIKLTSNHLKDLVKNDKTVEEAIRDLEKDGSHVIDKPDDKTTTPVDDDSTKNGKTSVKNTEIKNADKGGNDIDKTDKTLDKYNKSDDIGKINNGITENGKLTVPENTDNQRKDNVKTPKTHDTSKPVHNNDDDSIKNGESIVVGKTTVIKTSHKDKSGTKIIDETSTETNEVVGNDGKSDSNDKNDNETIKNSKSKENKGLKDSDRKSKTVEKIKKQLGKHDTPEDIDKDNGGNTKLVKTIVIDKDTVIKNFLRKDDRLNSTGKDDNETTKKGNTKVTEGTDKDGQDKNKTDKTIEKIDEKDDTSDAIDKENDNAIKNGKSIGIISTTLIKKDSRKDDEKTTKNGKSTVAEKSWKDKNEKKIKKRTKKVSGTDDESNKNNDVSKSTPGKATVIDNSSGVKNVGNDGDDETPEGGKLKEVNKKQVINNIKKDSKDYKLIKSDKTFRNSNEYTTNNDKKKYSNRATKKDVRSGNDNGSSDKDFHDDADNVESGKDRKHGNNGNKNKSTHKRDGDSINEYSVDKENDLSSKSEKGDKSPSNIDDQVIGSKNDNAPGTSGKYDKSESKEKRIAGSENDDDTDSNETYSKGGETQSNDDRNVVKPQKEDALRKSGKKVENSTKTDIAEGRKNDHESGSENIGNDTTSEDDKLTGITKETVSVKTGQDDNTNGSQDQSETGDDSHNGSSYENSSSRDCDDETEKDLEQNEDETDSLSDDSENDDTSNEEQQENGSECGDDSNNEDREDENENVLIGKSAGKKVIGSGENKDSNENYEDASRDSANSDESGQNSGQKDNKVVNDAPENEKSRKDGKYRNPGDKKVVVSENSENKDSDKDDKDASSKSDISDESGYTGDKTVVGFEYNGTPKKSGENSKSENNSDKKDENVVGPENRNNKDFHEIAKDESSNSKERGKTGSKRGHKRRNYTNTGKVVGNKNPRDTDSTTSENDGTWMAVTSEKPKIGQDESNDTKIDGSDETYDKSDKKNNKFRRNSKLVGEKQHRNDHETDSQSTESNKTYKSGQDKNDDTKRDESRNGDSSIKDNITDKSAKVDQFGRKRGHKLRNDNKAGTTVGHKDEDTDSSNSENDETSKDVKLTVSSEKPNTRQDENNNTHNGNGSIKKGSDNNDDNTSDKSDKDDKSVRQHNHKRRNDTKYGTVVGHNQNDEIDFTKSENDKTLKHDKLTVSSEKPKPRQDEKNDSKKDGSAKSDSSRKEDSSDDDITTDNFVKSYKSRRNGEHKHKHPTNIEKPVGENNDRETESTNCVNDDNSEDDKLTETSVKPTEINKNPVSDKPGQGKNNSDKKAATETKIKRNHGHKKGEDTSREDSDDDDDGKLSNNSSKGGKLEINGGIKDKKDAGFDNDDAPEKSGKGGKHGRNGSSQDKAVGPETGDSKTPFENDDDDAGVAAKGERIRSKKHKKPHKVVGRKGHKKNHETELLNIDNTETSEGIKSTDIKKKTTSDKPGQEENKTDENEKNEKKINRNHRSENGKDGENSDDDEDELSKKSGKGGRFVKKDKEVTESENDDAPENSEGENNNTNNGNGSIKKGSDNNDDNTSDKSDKGDKSGRQHNHKLRNDIKYGIVVGHNQNDEIDFTKSENDETLKHDKLTVSSEKPKPRQDEKNDSKKDGSAKSVISRKEDSSDDDTTTDKFVKSHKFRRNGEHKLKHPTNIGKLEGENNDRETESTNCVNDENSEDDKLTETSEELKTSQDVNNATKHVDSSVIEDLDDNDDDNSNKRDTSEKRKKRKHRNEIVKIFGIEYNHKTELTDNENNEASKKVKSTGNNDSQVSDKIDQDESNDAKEDESEKTIKKVESGTDSNNDNDDIVTGQSGKGDESVGKDDKNGDENLVSDSSEIVNLNEDGSEKSKKEIHGRKHKKSQTFVGRKGQKKYQETDLSNNNNETFEGDKSTELNKNPVSDKTGKVKNNSDKKTATKRKIKRNRGHKKGEDTSREDSDDDDEGKLSDNSGKGGKLGINGGIKDKKDAGFENDDAPEKSGKDGKHGRNGSSQDKAVGPETGDSKTPYENDDDDAGVAAKVERIRGKKHKKPHKVVGRKGHKKNHETELLNIDNTETSEGIKSTDIKKKTTSDKPGQGGNKNDENEETEKKINRNHRSENDEDGEDSYDDEDELSKKSGKDGRFIKKDKKVTESENDDAPEKSQGGLTGRHGGKQDKATETESDNKAYTKEHNDNDKDAAEKSNKGGRTHGKKHSHKVPKVVERKGLNKTDFAYYENDGVSKQVKSTVDGKKQVSDENSEDQKDETNNILNKEVGSEISDRLTNEARDGETNKDGKPTEITDKRLRIRDYKRRIKKNVTKTKKHLQSSHDRVDDGSEHNKDSKLTDKNTKSVNRNEKHKLRSKIMKRKSGDHSDSDTTEKSKSISNTKKAVTEETENNDKNDKTSTTNNVSDHENETRDDSNTAVRNKQSKTKKHNHRDTTNNGNKYTSSQVIRKHANTKDKDDSKTDAKTSNDKTSNDKDSSSDSENKSADDNEQQDNEYKKISTNNSYADKTTDDLEHEDTNASSENDDVSKNTGSAKEDTFDTKNTAVINTSKAKQKIHRRTTDIAPKTRNSIKRKTTETDDGLGKTEETSNKNTADNSSDNYDEDKSSSTSTDNKQEKSGSQTSSSSTKSERESKTSSTDTKKETSDNPSDKSSSSSNETADRQSKDEAKSKSYKNRKEESSESASGYGLGADQESFTKDGKKTTYKRSSEDSAHSEQQQDSKYTEESRDSEGKTVESGQKSAAEEDNNNSSDKYIEESDGKTKKSKKDSASAEDKLNQASSSSEYKKVDSNGNTAVRKYSSRRKSFESKQSSSTDEEYSSSS